MSDPAIFCSPHAVCLVVVQLHGSRVGYAKLGDIRSGFRGERAATSGNFKAQSPTASIGSGKKGANDSQTLPFEQREQAVNWTRG